MGFLFGEKDSGGGQTPSKSDAEVQDEALRERRRRLLAGGRSSNILTSGQGVLASTPSARKQLLGE